MLVVVWFFAATPITRFFSVNATHDLQKQNAPEISLQNNIASIANSQRTPLRVNAEGKMV